MKAVLVVDIDDDMIGEVDYTVLSKKEMVNGRAKLRPLPHKLQADWYTGGYKEGFNACLEEITGETE